MTWAKKRTATPDMVAAANPPAGFAPIESWSAFGWENGPIFERRTEEGLQRGFRVAEKHGNAGGFCHGGMLMTFADILLASAVYTVAKPPMVTVRLSVDFIAPAPVGAWVEGRAWVTGVDDRIVSGQGNITVDDTIVAALSGAFMVKTVTKQT